MAGLRDEWLQESINGNLTFPQTFCCIVPYLLRSLYMNPPARLSDFYNSRMDHLQFNTYRGSAIKIHKILGIPLREDAVEGRGSALLTVWRQQVFRVIELISNFTLAHQGISIMDRNYQLTGDGNKFFTSNLFQPSRNSLGVISQAACLCFESSYVRKLSADYIRSYRYQYSSSSDVGRKFTIPWNTLYIEAEDLTPLRPIILSHLRYCMWDKIQSTNIDIDLKNNFINALTFDATI